MNPLLPAASPLSMESDLMSQAAGAKRRSSAETLGEGFKKTFEDIHMARATEQRLNEGRVDAREQAHDRAADRYSSAQQARERVEQRNSATRASKDPSANQEPSAGKEPSAGREPSANQEPSAGKEPSAGREPSANREPSAGKEPSAGREPSASQEPSAGKEASANQEPSAGKEPSATQAPSPSESSASPLASPLPTAEGSEAHPDAATIGISPAWLLADDTMPANAFAPMPLQTTAPGLDAGQAYLHAGDGSLHVGAIAGSSAIGPLVATEGLATALGINTTTLAGALAPSDAAANPALAFPTTAQTTLSHLSAGTLMASLQGEAALATDDAVLSGFKFPASLTPLSAGLPGSTGENLGLGEETMLKLVPAPTTGLAALNSNLTAGLSVSEKDFLLRGDLSTRLGALLAAKDADNAAALDAAGKSTPGGMNSVSLIHGGALDSRMQMPVNIRFGHPGWGDMVAERSAMMASQNLKFVELQLDPPELGPLQVKISVNQEHATVSFVSANAQVREALDQSLGKLRELLEQQGLDLVNVDVSDHHAQQSTDEERDGALLSDFSEEEGSADEQSSTLNVVASQGIDHYA